MKAWLNHLDSPRQKQNRKKLLAHAGTELISSPIRLLGPRARLPPCPHDPGKLIVSQIQSNLVLMGWRLPAYCPGVTTVVVEVGGGAGSLMVVVRLTVVVVVVGGGVGGVMTSSCVQAPKQAAAPITTMRRDNVFIWLTFHSHERGGADLPRKCVSRRARLTSIHAWRYKRAC
jgi:hypothetical protein